MIPSHILRALAALALIATASHAEEAPAKPAGPATGNTEAAAPAAFAVGAPAPAFAPTRWFKGEPVTAFAKDKTYLVECWATWCGPCIAAIPHVNGLHTKFKDKGLVVIGINVRDKDEAGAAKLVAAKGDAMGYRVAYDGAESVANGWLRAAGVNGIPHAFVIRDNKLLWHGHPAELEDDTVAAMIAGTFDPVKMQAEAQARQTARDKYMSARNHIGDLIRDGKLTEALAALETDKATLTALNPSEYDINRAEIFSKQGDTARAKVALTAAAEKGAENAGTQYRVSRLILSTPGVGEPALAVSCARRAVELGDRHPVLCIHLARALYAAGDTAGATGELDAAAAVVKGKSARLEAAIAAALAAVKSGAAWPEDAGGAKPKPAPAAK